MALEPITRKEKIIAGQDLTPITRMEKFLKQYGGGGGGGGSTDAVLYTAQTLTDAQKQQARENIDAAIADFVVNGTINSDSTVTLDKTFVQIKEAVQAGKKVYAKLNRGITVRMPLVLYNTNALLFGATISNTDNSELYTLEVTASEAKFVSKPAFTYNYDGHMPQFSMSSDPIEAMEIATKQYVDNKECILKSATPGSTKKFKMTVDDSGNISATEVI